MDDSERDAVDDYFALNPAAAAEWAREVAWMVLEELDVSAKPCEGMGVWCGATGTTKLYVDGPLKPRHVFQLCAECAWLLTEQYHAKGLIAPWEPAE